MSMCVHVVCVYMWHVCTMLRTSGTSPIPCQEQMGADPGHRPLSHWILLDIPVRVTVEETDAVAAPLTHHLSTAGWLAGWLEV